MKDFWPGDGCGFWQFRRHRKDRGTKARRRLLREFGDRVILPGDKPVWPFAHDVVPVDLKDGHAHLDPLVLPMVSWLEAKPGVTSITSCQGHADGSPYFHFRAAQGPMMDVAKEMWAWRHGQRAGGYHLNFVLMMSGVRENEPAWMLQMYDTFALMRLNADMFGWPLNQQLHGIPDGTLGKESFEILADIADIEAAVAGRRPKRRRT